MVHLCAMCKRKMKRTIDKDRVHDKVKKVMHEYKEGKLHSGSKKGPKVKSRKQAVAIALSEGRRVKKHLKKKKK